MHELLANRYGRHGRLNNGLQRFVSDLIPRNRFKGLDLIDRVPDEPWTEVWTLYRRQRSSPLPPKKCKKAKWLSEEALQIAVKRREAKAKEKRKDIPV